jgi:O-antigen/teichoic acid export membrane protein
MTSVNKGIAWSGIAQAIISISDLLSMGVTLALFVDEKNYGVAALALWVFPVLDSITDFGIANAVIQKDGHSTSKLSTVFWLNSFIATILCGFLFLLAPWYASRVGQPTVAALMIAYCGKLILQNGYTIPIALMRKELRFAEIAKIRTAAHVAESISRPILAASGAVVWCFVIPLLIRSVLVLVMVQWRHRFIPSLTFRYREVTDYVRFGLKSGATAALYQLYVNIDYPLVGFIFGPSALGAYKLAYELVLEPVRSITNVVSDVALPTIAKIKHDMPQVRARYLGFVRLNLLAVLPFLILLYLIIPDAIALFGTAQSNASMQLTANCVQILCFVGVLRAVGFIGPPILEGTGHPGTALRYMVFATIVMPLCFVNAAHFFGDQHSSASVAIGWALGYPMALVVLQRLVFAKIGLGISEYLTATYRPVICGMISFGIGIAADAGTRAWSPWQRIIVISLLSLTSFAITARYIAGVWRSVRSAPVSPSS